MTTHIGSSHAIFGSIDHVAQAEDDGGYTDYPSLGGASRYRAVMNIRVVAAIAFLLVGCTPAPDPTAPKPEVVPKSTTKALSVDLNSPCGQDDDCSAIAGAKCMSGGSGATKGSRCRILCRGATDDRCMAPNACLSAGKVGGGEQFSCERTCTGDTDCHANEYSCQHVMGPTQPGFCVASPAGK